jgi:hypothetical protein
LEKEIIKQQNKLSLIQNIDLTMGDIIFKIIEDFGCGNKI